MTLHEALCIALACLEHRRLPRGSKDGQSAAMHLVDKAESERKLRTNDDEVGLFSFNDAQLIA